MRIEEVTEVSAELVEAIAALIAQLSSSSPIPSASDLEEVVASPATTLLGTSDRFCSCTMVTTL